MMKDTEGIFVPQISAVLFQEDRVPVAEVELRKHSISGNLCFNNRLIHIIGDGQGGGKKSDTTDDKALIAVVFRALDRRLQGVGYFDPRRCEEVGLSGDNDVKPTRQFAIVILIGFATHNDRLTHSRCLEMGELIGKVPGDLALIADAVIQRPRID